MQRDIDVRHAKNKTDRFALDLRQPDQLRYENRLQLVRHEFEFLLGERHEAPIILPGLVINLAEPPAFPFDVAQISVAQRYLLGAFSVLPASRRSRFAASAGFANHQA